MACVLLSRWCLLGIDVLEDNSDSSCLAIVLETCLDVSDVESLAKLGRPVAFTMLGTQQLTHDW